MRVLVTGAAGQVGYEIARCLAGRAQVAAHDRSSLDLANRDAIVARVREFRPEVIVNAAAYTNVDRAEAEVEAARAVNGIAPGVLAQEAKRLGALLVHFSTDYVYDGTKGTPYVETDPTHPLSAYGRTKLEGERAIVESGCDHLILRTSWVYAARGRNFMLTMLHLAATQPEIRVVDDQRGAPTCSRHLAKAVMEILERRNGADGVYHASAAGATTWFGFAQAIFAERARTRAFTQPRLVAITTRQYPTPAARPANSVLSNARLEATFGVRLPDWRAGLVETLSGLEG